MIKDLDIVAAEEDNVDKKLLTSKFLEEQNQRLLYSEDDGKDKGASFAMKIVQIMTVKDD